MIGDSFKKCVVSGLGPKGFRPLFPVVLAAVLLFLPFSMALSTEILTTDKTNRIEYGSFHTGDTVHDTLVMYDQVDGKRIKVKAVDSDQTCDCVTSEVLPDGRVAVSMLFEEAEPAGPMEKILYVFSESTVNDLLRIELSADHLKTTEMGSDTSIGDGNPPIFSEESHRSSGKSGPEVVFFYSPGCVSCNHVKSQVFPKVMSRWGDEVSIREINIDEPDGYLQMLNTRKSLEVRDTKSPYLIVVGDQYLVEGDDILENLAAFIQEGQGIARETDSLFQKESSPFVAAKAYLKSFTFWTVLGAGLLDGINPCAFATLVFFIGLLKYVGSSRKEIFIVGSGFTASVFVVYLLLGLGAFKILQSLSLYVVISKAIYLLTLLLIGFLIVLSVKDLVSYYRTGKTTDATLQLSRKNKQRIHNVMKRGLGTGNLLLGAVGIGILVTLFEAACTGQVYLPTIVLVLKDDLLNTRALTFLVIYNLMFVVPLIIVFILVYFGTTSEAFVGWSKRNYGMTRILLSLLFVGMCLIMLLQVIQMF